MIEFRMEIARNAEIPSIVDISVIAEMHFQSGSSFIQEEEAEALFRSATATSPEAHTMRMGSIEGSLFQLPSGYKDLGQAIQDTVNSDPDMCDNHLTKHMAKLLASKLGDDPAGEENQSSGTPFNTFFVCEQLDWARGVKINTLLPHMIAEISTITMGNGKILLNAELADLSEEERIETRAEVAKLKFTDFNLYQDALEVEGGAPLPVDVLAASLTAEGPKPLEYLLLDDIIDVDLLNRLLEEKAQNISEPE